MKEKTLNRGGFTIKPKILLIITMILSMIMLASADESQRSELVECGLFTESHVVDACKDAKDKAGYGLEDLVVERCEDALISSLCESRVNETQNEFILEEIVAGTDKSAEDIIREYNSKISMNMSQKPEAEGSEGSTLSDLDKALDNEIDHISPIPVTRQEERRYLFFTSEKEYIQSDGFFWSLTDKDVLNDFEEPDNNCNNYWSLENTSERLEIFEEDREVFSYDSEDRENFKESSELADYQAHSTGELDYEIRYETKANYNVEERQDVCVETDDEGNCINTECSVTDNRQENLKEVSTEEKTYYIQDIDVEEVRDQINIRKGLENLFIDITGSDFHRVNIDLGSTKIPVEVKEETLSSTVINNQTVLTTRYLSNEGWTIRDELRYAEKRDEVRLDEGQEEFKYTVWIDSHMNLDHCEMEIIGEGFEKEKVDCQAEELQTTVINIDAHREGTDLEIEGNFTTTDGEPIPNKEIDFKHGEEEFTLTTDEDGQFSALTDYSNPRVVASYYNLESNYEPAEKATTVSSIRWWVYRSVLFFIALCFIVYITWEKTIGLLEGRGMRL